MRSRLERAYSFGLPTFCQNRIWGGVAGPANRRHGFACMSCAESCAHHVSGRLIRSKFIAFQVTQSSLWADSSIRRTSFRFADFASAAKRSGFTKGNPDRNVASLLFGILGADSSGTVESVVPRPSLAFSAQV